MRNFTGFQRKAIIIVPSEEQYAQRLAKRREAVDGESIRDTSIMEMKGGFNNILVNNNNYITFFYVFSWF